MATVVLAFLTMSVQMLGYATTCTQGDSGSALSGSVMSGIFLLVMAILLVRGKSSSKPLIVSSVITGAVLMATMVITSSIWLGTLRYGTPCGESFQFYALDFPERALILTGYLGVPVLNVALCLALLCRQIKAHKQRA